MCWSYIEMRVSGSLILRDGAHRRGAPWRPAKGRGFCEKHAKTPPNNEKPPILPDRWLPAAYTQEENAVKNYKNGPKNLCGIPILSTTYTYSYTKSDTATGENAYFS